MDLSRLEVQVFSEAGVMSRTAMYVGHGCRIRFSVRADIGHTHKC